MNKSARILLAIVSLPTIVAAQNPPELAPAVARLLKTYEKTPDGAGFFGVWVATPELKSNGLWVRYGDKGGPPVRIDRATGNVKTMGAKGKGPNDFADPTDMISAVDGTIGVRDPAQLQFFWVDKDGIRQRAWRIPTTDNMQGKTFTDAKGRLYIGRTAFDQKLGRFGDPFVVRVDSARGLVDSMPIPFNRDPKWTWDTRRGGANTSATRYYVQFAPYPDWGIDRQGRLYAWFSDSNFIQIFDGGKTQRLVMPAWLEPLSAQDRASVAKRLDDIEKREKDRGAEFLNARPPVPNARPQILEVMPDVAGGIAVRRSKPCAEFKSWKAPITGAAPPDSGRCGFVERFDASGSRQTPFTYGQRDQLLAIRGDTVWMARRDEDDLVKILELVIPRR